VNAIIPPLAIDAPTLSIRRFPADRIKMDDMIRFGSVSPSIAYFLKALSRVRLNMIISGGTGSGKTTLLNALSGYIPHRERIVTIEDSAELQLQQPHVVRLETRPPNIEGKGQVTQRDLVRNSLRMRPDRIILGEIREAEALDMLQAMNTGHDGSLTTIHANTPRDATSRIENMVAMSGLNLSGLVVRKQIASAIQVIIQVERLEDGNRRVTSIQEIDGMEGEVLTMSEIFQYKRLGHDKEGNLLGEHSATGLVPGFFDRFAQRGIEMNRSIFDIS
jgi:pilus assembly protein CpaF